MKDVALKSQPLALIRQRSSFSGNTDKLTYNTVLNTSIGVSDSSIVNIGSRLSSNSDSDFISSLSYENPLNLNKHISFGYDKQGQTSSILNGMQDVYSLRYNKNLNDLREDESEQTSFYSDYIGLFNIRSIDGELITSLDASLGMNFIKLPKSIYGDQRTVIIELVVDGSVIDKREHTFSWITQNGEDFFENASINYATNHGEASVFASLGGNLFNHVGYNLNVSNNNDFGLGLDYRINSNLGLSGTLNKSDGRLSNDYNFYGFVNVNDFNLNLRLSSRYISYKSADSVYNDSSQQYTTMSVGAQKTWGEYNIYGAYYRDFNASSSEFTSIISRGFDLENARINLTLNLKKEFGSNVDDSIGLNISYIPIDRNKLRLSGSVFYDGKNTKTSAEATYEILENATLSGMASFSDSDLQGVGSNFNYNDGYLNGLISAYSYIKSGQTSMHGSLSSSTMLTASGISLAKSNQDSQVQFIGNNSNNDSNKVVIGNTKKDVSNGDAVNLSGNNKYTVYSPDGMMELSDTSEFYLPKYRSVLMNYSSTLDEENEVLVSGRIIDGKSGLSGLNVHNHSSHTTTTENGYFSLLVDKHTPIITITQDGKTCADIDIDTHSGKSIYLGRIQCNMDEDDVDKDTKSSIGSDVTTQTSMLSQHEKASLWANVNEYYCISHIPEVTENDHELKKYHVKTGDHLFQIARDLNVNLCRFLSIKENGYLKERKNFFITDSDVIYY